MFQWKFYAKFEIFASFLAGYNKMEIVLSPLLFPPNVGDIFDFKQDRKRKKNYRNLHTVVSSIGK